VSEKTEESWLPNLVGGVSIWKLADDLNEDKFFGGRLLVPETEGSETLPSKVSWDLTGLVPLSEARASHGEEVQQAIEDFFECLECVGKVFGDESSGFHAYKDAFTVPALDAEGDDNYFYDPAKKMLLVINWGASPRSITSSRDFLFGYLDFDQLFEKERADAGVGGGGGGATAAAGAAEAAKADGDEEGEEEEEEKEKKDGLPWWAWALAVAAIIVLLLLVFFFLDPCNRDRGNRGLILPDGAVLLEDGGVLLPDGNVVDPETFMDGGADAAADGGADAAGDGGGDAAGDGGGDAAGDGGGDAAGDGGGSGDGGGAGDGGGSGDGDGGAGGGGGGGGSGGAGGEIPPSEIIYVPVDLIPSGGGGARDPSHRVHFHPDATAWRIAGGANNVRGTRLLGREYHVWLKPGRSFDSVNVQWRDGAGRWHNH
jgi:hypothetical protein